MAVSAPHYTQATYRSSGTGNLTWHASAAAGMLALLHVTGGSGSSPAKQPVDISGWKLLKSDTYTKTWSKVLTSTDVASPLPVLGNLPFLAVFPGAGSVGKTSDDVQSVTITQAGGALAVFGRGRSALTPATGKLGTDVQNVAYSNRYTNGWYRLAASAGYLALDGTWNGSDSVGFELIPIAGPNAPTLVSPAASATVDPAAVNTFTLVHNSNQSAVQVAIKVKIVNTTTATTRYVLADGTLSATETAVSTSVGGLSVDAGEMTSGNAYTWTAATSEDGSTFSSWATATAFSAATKPSVTATLTTAAEDLTPTASWSATVTGAQTAYRTKVTVSAASSSDDALWDSGVVPGTATSVDVTGIEDLWTNGATYKSWTIVQDSTTLWSSEDDSAAATISWTAPATPSSISAANSAGQPLAVTVGGIASGMELLEIQYSTDGVTYEELVSFASPGTSEVVSVPLASYGVPWYFRARAANVVDGVTLYSAWVTIGAAVASTDVGAWLVADDGSSYVSVRVKKRTRGTVQASSVWYGIGSTLPRVDSGPTHGEAGTLTFLTLTYAEHVALTEFLEDVGMGQPFRYRPNPERYGTTYYDLPSVRIARTSALSEDMVADAAVTPRLIPIEWVSQ